MSRIHEALKRAEQERAAGQGGRGEPAQPVVSSSEEVVSSTPEHFSSSPATSGMPSFSSSFTFDTLLARCAQSDWTPDKKTMLFFNSEEQGYGSEEFRTLRSRLYQLREKQPLKKVLITSALPKEGKSFMATRSPRLTD